MSDKFGINVSSGISGVASGESDEGLSGGMVDGLKSKTLIESPGEKGVLSDGVRVSKESKALVRESNRGTAISGTESKCVESGNLTNDKHDASRNRVVEVMSRKNNNRWESWGVMNMVGRVLDGKFYMDNEVEDVNESENQGELNLAGDVKAWQDAIGEPTSVNRIDINRTDTDNDSVELDSSCPGAGSGLNGNQDLVSHEMVPDWPLETKEEFNVKDDVLMPEARGEHYITEKEGEYNVTDLVWGKVRSHPWWPGQIFAPSAASDKAMKYFKRESYLIAYFGDQTFAWNEGSKIKPFWTHFSEMEQQSNADGFSHAVQCALDETAQRVEFGLSCPCVSQEVYDGIKFQVVANAGIREESTRRAGGDSLSSAASFLPGDALQFLKSLAECPRSKPDRLQFTIAKAQLLAYNRRKGYYQLPVFEEFGGLLEDDTHLNVTEVMEGLIPGSVSDGANDVLSRKRKSTAQHGSSRRRKHLSGDEDCPKIKEKFLSVLMSSGSSSSQNNDERSLRRSARKVISSGENHEMVNSVGRNSRGKRQKSLPSTSPHGETQAVETIPADFPTPDVVLSKLILAAKKPMQGHDAMVSVVGVLRDFRNWICLEKSSVANVKMDSEKCKREQPSDFQTADTSGFEGMEDSYWTDRIIQSHSQDHVLFEHQKPDDRGAQPEANAAVVSNLDDNKERNVIVDLDLENLSAVNEVTEEYCPTALILNFSNLESIPPVMNLNEIFNRYGPLDESETKILSKSKRAKVIFKRRADAETAFSSTGKYSIFGPALISYRLHYAPKPRKSRASSKQNEKTKL